ncbi:cysteine hydrolase family protein [Sporosarcina sp. Te-1]|uniref:cysteine hydrolase family protein n=1 Tax=Sporosarcina sp. Te-1 TaxID=2818390 RepID=UPI001A9CE677|nr:cysteine hydrolase family protein [Sporosarcina sp. Te-1]QTD42075.1 cysteine hydrolase [Sporosarcina sp. Te-1]
MNTDKRALLIIDVQMAFHHEKWGKRNNEDAEDNIRKLLIHWREKGWTVIHVQHTSDNPDSLFYPQQEGFAFKKIIEPIKDEPIISKKVNSSFIGTNLEEFLKQNGIETVVITGLTTPHCVATTTRMSGNLGFDTYLVSDATAAFGLKDHNGTYFDAETIHNTSLATLHEEFATILTTEQILSLFE